MLKAVVSRGEIRPLQPLPSDWREGQPLRVEKDDGETPVEEIDRDFAVAGEPVPGKRSGRRRAIGGCLAGGASPGQGAGSPAHGARLMPDLT
jgi:hypothetical protein